MGMGEKESPRRRKGGGRGKEKVGDWGREDGKTEEEDLGMGAVLRPPSEGKQSIPTELVHLSLIPVR